MIKRNSQKFPNEVVERSARTALERLSQKRSHLQKAEFRYAEASTKRSRREALVTRAMAELIEAKESERRRKARCERLTLRYSDIYMNYSDVLLAAGMTESEIAQFFGDLTPAIFIEKKATA